MLTRDHIARQLYPPACHPLLYYSGRVQGIAMNMSVCVLALLVCLFVHSHNTETTQSNFTILCILPVAVACCDLLCTSGFMDDVMFSHNG